MSSTPQQVPLRPYPRRSLAGPVVLIIVGLVFLLANMQVITYPRLAWIFAHYWPVLLILWGLIKLLEYMAAQREGYRPRGIGAGGVILVVFLVIFGMAATRASRVNWNAVGDEMNWDGNFGWFGKTYSFSDQVEQAFTPGSSIQVVSDRGDVSVNAWDQNTVRVVVHKRVVSDSDDSANKVNEATKPMLNTAGAVLTINANTTGGGSSSRVTSDLEVYVPRAAAVEVSTRRGDVLVRARDGNVRASSSRGDITIEDVKGDASITARNGSVQASKITGELTVEAYRVDDTTISDIGGAVTLRGEFMGSTKLAKVAKGVQFSSSKTDLKFGKLDGEMTMDIGELRASQLAGPFSIVTRSKDIHLDDITGDVKVENTNGEVDVHAGKLPLGNISIDNHKGEVQVTVPAGARFALEARTRRGDINSDFGEVTVSREHGEASANGTIGSGGPRLTITNQYGGIQIRKAG